MVVIRFFEGWYYRVTLLNCGQTFAFMYSIEDQLVANPTAAAQHKSSVR